MFKDNRPKKKPEQLEVGDYISLSGFKKHRSKVLEVIRMDSMYKVILNNNISWCGKDRQFVLNPPVQEDY